MGRGTGWRRKNAVLAVILAVSSLCLGGCGRVETAGLPENWGNFLHGPGELLASVDCDSAAVSVSRTFTIAAGEQGIVTADYRREEGAAGIVILKDGEELAALEIPGGAEREAAESEPQIPEDGQAEQALSCGTVETALDCGVYTVKVESGSYSGTVRCTLKRKEKRPG